MNVTTHIHSYGQKKKEMTGRKNDHHMTGASLDHKRRKNNETFDRLSAEREKEKKMGIKP